MIGNQIIINQTQTTTTSHNGGIDTSFKFWDDGNDIIIIDGLPVDYYVQCVTQYERGMGKL